MPVPGEMRMLVDEAVSSTDGPPVHYAKVHIWDGAQWLPRDSYEGIAVYNRWLRGKTNITQGVKG